MTKPMKTLLLSLAALGALPAAALPDVVTYAARVENDAGPFNGTVSVTFSLHDAPTAGTELWTETVASLVVVDGDLVHDLGSIEPLEDSVLARDDLFLSVTMNGDTLEPRVALRAVPYALKARDAETLQGLAPADLVTKAEIDARIVSFADLSGIPAGFADNVDNDTIATAAANGGLTATNNAFSIGTNGVTSQHIQDGAVNTADLANNAVTTTKILNDAVTNEKMDNDAVGSAEIIDRSITLNDLGGRSTRVFLRPVGCGGGLQPASSVFTSGERPTGCVGGVVVGGVNICTSVSPCFCATCKTLMCDPDEYMNCGGSCVETAPKTCEIGVANAWPSTDAVGFLVFGD